MAAEAANQAVSLSDQHYTLTNCDIYVLSQQNDAHPIGSMTGEQDKARCSFAGHVAPALGILPRKN